MKGVLLTLVLVRVRARVWVSAFTVKGFCDGKGVGVGCCWCCRRKRGSVVDNSASVLRAPQLILSLEGCWRELLLVLP